MGNKKRSPSQTVVGVNKKTRKTPQDIPVSFKSTQTLNITRPPPSEKAPPKATNSKAAQHRPNIVAACLKWLENHKPPLNKVSKQTPTSMAEYFEFLEKVYGQSKRRPSDKIPLNDGPLPAFTVNGQISPNFSAFPEEIQRRRLIPTHNGIASQIAVNGDDAVDMYVGLDFGTSCTKVVISDANRRQHYAVPFFEVGAGNPFLMPSHVFLAANGRYCLDSNGKADGSLDKIRDMKLTLMQAPGNVSYLVHATAYLALVTRHARGWLFSTYGDTYRQTEITWGLNLGLPAEKSEDEFLSLRFQALAVAAVNLAGYEGEITEAVTAQYLSMATHAVNGESHESLGLGISPELVGVYPEIAAQVVAFVESERWDAESRPFVTLIDIGAGTVDVSFFSIEKRGERRFQFFQNKVAENGVMNLHRERIEWLREILKTEVSDDRELRDFLDDHFRPTDRLGGIPESVSSYLGGVSFANGQTVDDEFFNKRYRRQVFADVISPVHRFRVPKGEHWLSLPVFICGGGSRMPLYGSIVGHLNNISEINWLQAKRYQLTTPSNLIAPGMPRNDYDRLSVAYGLSFEKVGKIIRSHEIDDFVSTGLPLFELEAPGPEVC